jgi:hypothetical protein
LSVEQFIALTHFVALQKNEQSLAE